MKYLIVIGLFFLASSQDPSSYMKCADDAMLSDAGKMKVQEIFKLPADGSRPSMPDAMKKFDEARAAVQATDADKVDKWLSCLSQMGPLAKKP